MDDIYGDHRAFHLALVAPAASPWDIRILMMSERATERYVRIGFGLLDPDPGEKLVAVKRISCSSMSSASATPRSPPGPWTSTWHATRTWPTTHCPDR